MSLQKSIFFAAAFFYAMSLLACLAVIASVVIGIASSTKIDVISFGFAVIGFTLLRVVFTVWLRRLGGVPLEYRKK